MVGQIRHSTGAIVRHLHRHPASHTRMYPPQRQKLPDIYKKLPVFFKLLPVDPSDAIILTVSIIISILRISKFITGKNERYSLCQYNRCNRLSHQPVTLLHDLLLPGSTLHTAVDTEIPVVAIGSALSVFLIMLCDIAESVCKGKTVIICKIIHKSDHRMLFFLLVQIFDQITVLMIDQLARSIKKIIVVYIQMRITALLLPYLIRKMRGKDLCTPQQHITDHTCHRCLRTE